VKRSPMTRSTPLRRTDGKDRASIAPKAKKCAKTKGGCGEEFRAWSQTQAACSPRCAQAMAEAKREKAEKRAAAQDRAETRRRKEAMKKRSEWLKDAETQVNRYVRLRDSRLGCVSCPRPASWDGQWHASHFRSVGAASAVRFCLWNIHRACSVCNHFKSGNLSEYEPRLRARIGDEKVDWLRTQNQLADYSIEYLKRLKSVFMRKANRMAKRLES